MSNHDEQTEPGKELTGGPPDPAKAPPPSALAVSREPGQAIGEYRPRVSVPQAELAKMFNDQRELIRTRVLQAGVDYGLIPGTKGKSLWQPGAEKLLVFHGLVASTPVFDDPERDRIERWDADPPFFYYRYRVDIVDPRSGVVVGSAYGSCNSREKKYALRWAFPDEAAKAGIDTRKVEDGGDPPERWRWKKQAKSQLPQWRIPNPEMPDLVNTIDKMAQKRALIRAVRLAVAASGIFTEDEKGRGKAELGELTDAEIIEGTARILDDDQGGPEPATDAQFEIAKALFNEANLQLQEADQIAYFKHAQHVLNTLTKLGISTAELLTREQDKLIAVLVAYAVESMTGGNGETPSAEPAPETEAQAAPEPDYDPGPEPRTQVGKLAWNANVALGRDVYSEDTVVGVLSSIDSLYTNIKPASIKTMMDRLVAILVKAAQPEDAQ